MSAFGGKAEITAQRSMIFDPKPTITFDAPCRLQLCGKFRVCVFASCITAVRWDMVGSTGRITQYPTKAAISSKPAGSCISISELAENEGRQAWKSPCVNLTELNDEDRHQSYLHFRPNAFDRRTDPFQCSVF
jgi:hypothetical protein